MRKTTIKISRDKRHFSYDTPTKLVDKIRILPEDVDVHRKFYEDRGFRVRVELGNLLIAEKDL